LQVFFFWIIQLDFLNDIHNISIFYANIVGSRRENKTQSIISGDCPFIPLPPPSKII
jgi:hypothetical protein